MQSYFARFEMSRARACKALALADFAPHRSRPPGVSIRSATLCCRPGSIPCIIHCSFVYSWSKRRFRTPGRPTCLRRPSTIISVFISVPPRLPDCSASTVSNSAVPCCSRGSCGRLSYWAASMRWHGRCGEDTRSPSSLSCWPLRTQMPAYYTTWGRYTLLAGTALLTFAMAAAIGKRVILLALSSLLRDNELLRPLSADPLPDNPGHGVERSQTVNIAGRGCRSGCRRLLACAGLRLEPARHRPKHPR